MSASTTAARSTAAPWVWPRTSVGAKILVALTGLGLAGFVLVHMLGNMQVFLGPEALNSYAALLKAKPELLWAFRLGLLAMVVIHIVLTIRLRRGTFAARPSPYVVERVQATSRAAQWMLLSGLLVLAFILYHLAHFTLGWTQGVPQVGPDGQVQYVGMLDLRDPLGRHDVYSMVIHGFRDPLVVGIYAVAQLLLGMHLYHGVSSMFQTLGLNNGKNKGLLRWIGPVYAAIIVVGNIAIPVAILAGLVGLPNGG